MKPENIVFENKLVELEDRINSQEEEIKQLRLRLNRGGIDQ